MTKIGDILRQARLKKGYSIDELQQITKIQRRYLESIEDDDLTSLPGTFYVRSFIEQYALAVDIDPEPLLRAYSGEDVDLVRETQPVRPPESLGEVSRKTSRGSSNAPKAKRASRVPVVLFSLLAVAIIAVVVVLTVLDRQENPIISRPDGVIINSTTESTTVKSTTKSSTKESTAQSTTQSTTQSSAPTAPQPEFVMGGDDGANISMTLNNVTSPVTLEFTGIKEESGAASWLGVYLNGSATFTHTLKMSETVSTVLPADAVAATISLGRPGYVSIKVNGQDLNFNQSDLTNLKRRLLLTINYAAATGTSTPATE